MKTLYSLLILILLVGCKTTKSTLTDTSFKPLFSDEEVYVVTQDLQSSSTAQRVGEFKIVDSGFSTNCSYDEQLEKAKEVAREAGANLLYVNEIKNPDGWSTCFRLFGELYFEENQTVLENYKQIITDKNKSTLPEDADYAVIYFYRSKGGVGPLIGYKIRHNDDTVIGRTRANEKFAFKTKEFGEQVFWAKTETRASIMIDVEQGQEYYVKCGVKMGAFAGRPEIAIIENHIGREEYEKVKSKGN